MACVISFKVPPPTVSYLLNQPRQLCPEPAPRRLRGDDVEKTGVVEKVSTKDGSTVLTVSGTEGVDPATITQIA